MKQILFSGLIFFIFSLKAYPQASPTNNFTLEECLNYAYENAAEARKSDIDIEIAKASIKETRGIGLPQIDGQVELSHNYAIQTAFLPAQFLDPTAPEGSPPIAVRFGVAYSGLAGINVNQMIFNGSYFVGLQAARTFKELSVRNKEATKVEISANVSKAYFSVLVSQERLALLDKNLSRLDSTVRETRALYENGFAEKLDVDRLEVSYNNLKLEQDNTQRLYDLSIELLKFQMGMSVKESLAVQGKISDYELMQVSDAEIAPVYENRIEYNLLETNENLLQLDLKNQRTNYLPNLSAFFTFGYNAGTDEFDGLFDFGNNWFQYGVVGLRLNIPFFDGGQREYKIQQTKLEMKKMEIDRENLEKSIDFESKQAQINYRNAVTSLTTQKENMELAQEVLRVTRIKYVEGVGSNLEVVDAETSYKEAETNYYSALYDALVARVDLQKALGNLVE
ncbi:MAG: TolC family protein [Thermonemataceae bacterium]|mgnify:CR=1 FL=1